MIIDAKKLKENEFYGHYTTIDTLVNFLFKPETEENKNCPTYLRLSNANQLNDPMEGKALLAILGLDAHMEQYYKPTNVFLSSLTVVKDSLPMWKEYAEESREHFWNMIKITWKLLSSMMLLNLLKFIILLQMKSKILLVIN